MRKNTRAFLLVCCCLWLLPGCSREDTPSAPAEGGEVCVALSVKALGFQPAGGGVTRSTGPCIDMIFGSDSASTRAEAAASEAETKIHKSYLVQFNGTAPGSTVIKWGDISLNPENGQAAFEFANTGKVCRVYVVANFTPAVTEGATTLADFEKSMATYTPTINEVSADGLPMCGYADFNPIASVSEVPQIPLKAMVARLVVTYTAEPTVFKAGTTPKIRLRNAASGTIYNDPGDPSVATLPAGVSLTTHDVGDVGTATYTCYVPENLSGDASVSGTVGWRDRTDKIAPKTALYFEITGIDATLNAPVKIFSYLGDPAQPKRFNIRRNYSYKLTGVIKNTDKVDERIRVDEPLNLSKGGTANCYIVSGTENNVNRVTYCFDSTVPGNNSTVTGIKKPNEFGLGGAKYARVLWQTGNAEHRVLHPSADSLYVKDGKVYFSLDQHVTTGNAVIGIFADQNPGSPCLWSWHIWRVNGKDAGTIPTNILCQKTPAAPGKPATFNMMDRNLGAFNNNINDVNAIGLLYQWGRKDPFPGAPAFVNNATEPSNIYGTYNNGGTTGNWSGMYSIQTRQSDGTVGTEDWARKYPTTFIIQPADPYDWMKTKNDNLWGNPWVAGGTGGYNGSEGVKSIYDPCPVGYRVPPQDTWNKAVRGTWSNGQSLTGIVASGTFWFPASGSRDSRTGGLVNVSTIGYYWSSSPFSAGSKYSGYLYLYSGTVNLNNYGSRAAGLSVRCVSG